MISAATPMFAENGFTATSVRDIEVAADVKRGMLVYHFGDKDTFWKAVADSVFDRIASQRKLRVSVLKDMSRREGVAMIIRFHVRIFAQYPELSRLMAQEARQKSWRIEYLVTQHIKPGSIDLEKYVSKALNLTSRQFAHWYYIMVSGCATIFSFEPECALLFGFDSRQDKVVEAHANMLVGMLLGRTA
jgi:AcrR family transcriptional regulator